MAEVQNVVWRFEAQMQAVIDENDRQVLAAAEMWRAEAACLKQRIDVLEQENRRLSEANEAVKQDIGEVSGLKELLGNVECKHEELRKTVARQGNELTETRRRNSELGGRVQQLKEENRRLGEVNEALKGQLARAEAGQQNAVAGLQEPIAAGRSKVTEDVRNLEPNL
jgi:chromosome segregation ATPase